MRVLLIKTSSMGDIIHTLPALTDAGKNLPHLTVDWVVEESFAEIPTWHARVGNVIPVALRRWRKAIFSRATRLEWQALRKRLQANQYDLVLDAQSLVKSAFLTLFANGLRVGLDFHSARERLASYAYQRKCKVNFHQHAIVRMRSLFSQALDYPLPTTTLDFGLDLKRFQSSEVDNQPYFVFLHGTTWTSKQWPEAYWIELATLAGEKGYRIKISGGNKEEMERAERIAKKCQSVDIVPRLTLFGMAQLLANAKAVVAVDTGFGHLAAALNVPTVSLYGSTDPNLTGALGNRSIHLAASFSCAPCLKRTCTYQDPTIITPACFSKITPARVFEVINAFNNSMMTHQDT